MTVKESRRVGRNLAGPKGRTPIRSNDSRSRCAAEGGKRLLQGAPKCLSTAVRYGKMGSIIPICS
jgi:hypothetical protein